MANLLSIVQDFCERVALSTPTTVMGSSDAQILQLKGLLTEECNDLAARHGWEALTFETAITTLATEDQGALTGFVSKSFRAIKNNTMWDRTDRLPVMGPLSGSNWQMRKALLAMGPRYNYRIRGGKVLANPVPPAGHSWYFEYLTRDFCTDPSGITYKRRFDSDDNVILLPDDLCLQGLRWRWKKEKGFDYAEDFRTYEAQVKDAMGRDGGKPPLYMDSAARGPVPGIWVSPYNTVP